MPLESQRAFWFHVVSSTYFEGRCCPLAKRGYSRDGKRGKLQIVFGLLCDRHGCPVAVEVFDGNTADPKTLTAQIDKLRGRFGLNRVVLVGDRGMLTDARIRDEVRPAGLDWISALRAPAIRRLADAGAVQTSLFDETDLIEIRSDDFPGERLMVCRNPLLAERRARKREELLRATEELLDAVAAATRRCKGPLKGADEIALRVGKVVGKYKMAKHFELDIGERAFGYSRKADGIAAEAALDGIHIVRTSLPADELGAAAAVAAYKGLSVVERAFRSYKTVDLKVRPSTTTPTAGSARTSSCACSPTTSNGTCANASSRCCSTTTRPTPPGPRAPPSSRPPRSRTPRATRRAASAPRRACRCTASRPSSPTWRRSPGTASSCACPTPSRSMSSPVRRRCSAKRSDCSACAWTVPSSATSNMKIPSGNQWLGTRGLWKFSLDRYCAEVAFRLNEGAQCFSTLERMEALIRKCFHRTITYEDFVGGTTEHVVRPHLRPRNAPPEQTHRELSVFDLAKPADIIEGHR